MGSGACAACGGGCKWGLGWRTRIVEEEGEWSSLELVDELDSRTCVLRGMVGDGCSGRDEARTGGQGINARAGGLSIYGVAGRHCTCRSLSSEARSMKLQVPAREPSIDDAPKQGNAPGLIGGECLPPGACP